VGWTLGDGEAPATWVRVALLGDAVGAPTPRLTKGTQVYCEGPLSLGTWTGRDGDARAGTSRRGRSSPWGRLDGGNPRPGRAMNMAHTTMSMVGRGERRARPPVACRHPRTRRPDRHSRIPPPATTCRSGNPTVSGITGQVAL
jgi:hypothetical protein